MSSTGGSIGYGDQSYQGLTNVKQVEAYEFSVVNTTSSTAITATGSNTIVVASAASIVVDQNLAIDSGTGLEYVRVTAVAGTSITAVFAKTHSGTYAVSSSVLRQACTLGDPNTLANLAAVVAKGVQGAFALSTQALHDSGRTPFFAYIDNATGTSTSEVITTLQLNVNNVATSGTQYTVPAGKTLRIQAINLGLANTTSGLGATTLGSTVRLRVNAASAAVLASPLVGSWQIGQIAAGTGQQVPVSLAGEVEIAGGTSFAFTRTDTNAAAILGLSIIGYLY